MVARFYWISIDGHPRPGRISSGRNAPRQRPALNQFSSEKVMAARGGMARAAKESGGVRDKRMMDFTKLQKGTARKYGKPMR